MPRIDESRILVLATHGFEQSELEVPRDELRKAGADVKVATPDGNPIRGWKGSDWGETVPADLCLADAAAGDFDALVLPGGQINPDLLRVDADAVALIRAFAAEGRIIAAICHAPWLLIEAGLVEGREMTSYGSIRTDLKNAGARVKDVEVIADDGIVTSRSPDDLPAFVAKIIEEVEEGRHPRKVA